ncbi:FAD:protein FMN transferase [Achromobacter insuavis]
MRRASAAIAPTTWQGVALGADAELRLYHPDPRAARRLIAQALAELHRLEGIFSLYRDDSALARLNRQGYLADPPADLLRLLGDGLRYSRLTDGVFDPTVQPLWQLYASHFARAGAATQGPSEAELAQALARVSYHGVTLDSRRIALQRPGMGITLNGIAQGYITDCITRLLRQGGLERALVDMGEIRGLDRRASPGDWRVGLADPRAPQRILASVPVRNQALATSGGYGTALDAAGRYTHLFDPAPAPRSRATRACR